MLYSTNAWVAGLATIAGGSLVLTAVLVRLDRLYQQTYLRLWALSWLALALRSSLLGVDLLLAERFEVAHPIRVVLAGLALTAGLYQALLLLAGTFEVVRDRPVSRRVLTVWLVLLGAASLTLAPLLATLNAAPQRLFARSGIPALVIGLAFVVAAFGLQQIRRAQRPTGSRLVIVGLATYGIHQLHTLGVATLQWMIDKEVSYAFFLGFLDVLAQFLVGLGMVVWFLEGEREEVLRASKQVEHLAYHDPLTGLPNRELFLARLRRVLARSQEQTVSLRKPLAVLFLDLDRFKVLNDTLGHDYGDELLIQAARRLQNGVRAGDTVSRLGGDEFTLLLPDLESTAEAGEMAEMLREELHQPYLLHGHEIFVTTSMGASVYPGDGEDAETLLKNADMAMYQAKEKGPGNFQGYSPLMGARALERLSLESDLRRAMDNGEFALYYQPVLDVATGAIGGVEALIRWQHPWRGLVGPDDFLDLVEIIGLSDALDMWVMETACRQLKEWQDGGLTQLRVAVNLSARPFHQRDLVDRVERVLRQTGLSPQSLELEITETLAMQRAEVTLSVLERLKTLGVRVSIDDFGVGYSSLSYLRTFPIDTVKIDRSFVRDLTVDPSDAAIAAAVIAMAHSLNLEVVAEGVEGEEQLRFLEDHGCDRIQGYLLSPPKPAEECLARILEHREEVARSRSLGSLSVKEDGAAS
jgi:diguanylate cyclase (GGDEF)-like protein